MTSATDTRQPPPRAADRAEAARSSADELRAKVDFLASPAAYPEHPDRVEARETHMSWVFLTDGSAYKLKKPVVYPYLDFSTLQAREARCRDEVRLNRRLAPDVYLGVARLTRSADGRLAIDGAGDTVDWLVRMRRLPEERTLERLIASGQLTAAHVAQIGTVLARFYRGLAPAEVDAQRYVELLRAQHDANAGLLLRPEFALDGARVAQTVAAIERFFAADRALLEARAAGGHVVEGHGDLRPEHIFVLDAPVIIDCLEFNRALRLVDPFDEIDFLGLECERLGAAWVGARLRSDLEAQLGDRIDERLHRFYVALRACLRARLAAAHLTEPEPREPHKWLQRARDYLAIAQRAAEGLAAAR
jgi:aminoglycoside phosphotransferase family enzyme